MKHRYNWKEMNDKGYCVECLGDQVPGVNKGTEVAVWDVSIAELLDLVHTNPSSCYPKNRKRWQDVMAKDDGSWQQISSAEAIRRNDWPEGMKYMKQYTCDIVDGPMADTIRRVRVWGEDGDDFDRDRFDSGDMDCWRRMDRINNFDYKSGIIEMTISFGGNFDKTAEQLIWGGAAAALLVDRLEDAGYRVGITGIGVNVGLDPMARQNPMVVHRLAIKDPEQPLNIDTLLMAVASPWFFRVHCFRSYLEMPFEVIHSLGRIGITPSQFQGKLHIDHIYNKNNAQKYLDETIEMFSRGRELV